MTGILLEAAFGAGGCATVQGVVLRLGVVVRTFTNNGYFYCFASRYTTKRPFL